MADPVDTTTPVDQGATATAIRFVTFWPVEARLVHIRDLHATDKWRALCTRRWAMDGHQADDDYDVAPGEEYLICATCSKIRDRREK